MPRAGRHSAQPRKPRRPTEAQVAVLRKITAAGGIVVTMTNGKPECTYVDGAVPDRCFSLSVFVRLGWLRPADGCQPLFREAWAQRYVARRP